MSKIEISLNNNLNSSKNDIDQLQKYLELNKLELNLNKKTRRDVFDFITKHFYYSNIKTRKDYENKFKSVILEKYNTKDITDEDAKKIYNHAFKWFKKDIKVKQGLLNEEEVKTLKETTFKTSNKPTAIKDPTQHILDNIKSIQKQKLLTKEEEFMYGRMVHSSNALESQRGRDALMNANLRLVISIAKGYNSNSLDRPDLILAGVMGLNTAISKFDPSKGNKFSTYATNWIRQSVGKEIQDKSRFVKQPTNVTVQIREVNKVERNLALITGEEPTHKDLKGALKERKKVKNLKRVNSFKKASSEPIPFDKPIGNSDSSQFSDLIADETLQLPSDYVIEQFELERTGFLLSILEPIEKEIVQKYLDFTSDKKAVKNFSYIARTLNMKLGAVIKIYNGALEKMKKYEKKIQNTGIDK